METYHDKKDFVSGPKIKLEVQQNCILATTKKAQITSRCL